MRSDSAPDAMARIASLLGRRNLDLPDHLAVVREGVVYHAGSTAPMIGSTFSTRRSGLSAPAWLTEQPQPFDSVQVFITSSEYSDAEPHVVSAYALNQHDPLEMLFALVALNRLSNNSDQLKSLADAYASSLPDQAEGRLRATLAQPKYHFLARQPILMSMMLALSRCTKANRERHRTPEMEPLKAAVLLVHAVGAQLGSKMGAIENDSDRLGGFSATAALYLAQNALFHETQDPMGTLVASDLLWNRYAGEVVTYRPDPSARAELSAGLGAPVDEFTSLARGLYAQAISWKVGEPLAVRAGLGLAGIPSDTLSAFLRAVSLPLADYASRAATTKAEWDFLALERYPVLELEDSRLVVLDADYLLSRTSSELWRYVADARKGTSRTQWMQFYGEAFELMIEDQLRLLAPHDLPTGTPFFFTEEDFQAAYDGKACDAAICYGEDWLLFEIETARFTLSARQLDEPAAFISDTKKIVAKKAKQLDQTATRLLRGLSASLVNLPSSAKRVFPIVIVPDTYPRFPATVRLVDEILGDLHLLRDARIQPLVVLSRSDIDILEAMLGEGVSPVDVLSTWLSSSLADGGLWNSVYQAYGERASRRPKRVRDAFGAVFDKAIPLFAAWGMDIPEDA